ncbi:MAG: response regulator [Rhodospirillaceae bacterium]|nr:response regulator [Rhodospirillaceae bacterium]
MDGSAGFHSQPGAGSTFWCTLSLEVPDWIGVEGPAAAPQLDLMGIRVLVVDPETDERALIAVVTEQAGAAVIRVPGPREAIAASSKATATQSPFDVAVLDSESVAAPQLEALGETPLVFVGGFDSPNRFELERMSNCVGFLGRPLSRDQILNAAWRAIKGGDFRGVCRPSPLAALPVPTVVAVMAEDRWMGLPVLVAEDHPVNQQVITRQLHLLGYEAEIHADGAAALAAWRERGYSAVVTDCHMPRMDGFQLTAAIRAQEAESGGHIPIIALTANALSGEAEPFMATTYQN